MFREYVVSSPFQQVSKIANRWIRNTRSSCLNVLDLASVGDSFLEYKEIWFDWPTIFCCKVSTIPVLRGSTAKDNSLLVIFSNVKRRAVRWCLLHVYWDHLTCMPYRCGLVTCVFFVVYKDIRRRRPVLSREALTKMGFHRSINWRYLTTVVWPPCLLNQNLRFISP